MLRGVLLWVRVASCPKLDDVELVVGPLKITLLNALNISTRNEMTEPSVMWVVFSIMESRFQLVGLLTSER